MITATHRFHGRSSLRFVYQRGKTVRGAEFSLRFILNNRVRTHRVAVVVSRKVSKSAVVRNRIRRRIYEIVRSLEDHISEPYDLVFTVYTEAAAKVAHAKLADSITTCLYRAGVIQKASANRGVHAIIEPKET